MAKAPVALATVRDLMQNPRSRLRGSTRSARRNGGRALRQQQIDAYRAAQRVNGAEYVRIPAGTHRVPRMVVLRVGRDTTTSRNLISDAGVRSHLAVLRRRIIRHAPARPFAGARRRIRHGDSRLASQRCTQISADTTPSSSTRRRERRRRDAGSRVADRDAPSSMAGKGAHSAQRAVVGAQQRVARRRSQARQARGRARRGR